MEEGSCSTTSRRSCICSSSRLESLPSCLLIDGILHRLEIQTLFTVACVCSKLRSFVSEALTDLPSLQITEFFPDSETVENILSRCKGLKTLTVDCLRLSDGGHCFIDRLGPNLEELKLLRSSSLDSLPLQEIGERCPNLRLLVLEVRDCVTGFTGNLSEMLLKCTKLESFCMKIRVRTRRQGPIVCHSIEYVNFLPKMIKSLTLEPLNEGQVVALVCGSPTSSTSISVSFLSSLQKLSLVLEVITDKVLSSITKSIPHLLELHLQDEPSVSVGYLEDLTDAGLETLRNCRHLKSLSLVRTYSNFSRVYDEGIFHISDGCRELESVRLVGFRSVTNAGFASILLSCNRLKRFEVKWTELTDLCFHNLLTGPSSLKEVIVKPCVHPHITSKIVKNICASNKSIELLNLRRCTNVTDKCIQYILSLDKLTSLDLSRASITDGGMEALSKCSSPIKSLSLRWCLVTDTGILLLFSGGGTISKTLSTLDLTKTSITDVAVKAIAREANAVTELCIRWCTYVTDKSIKALARKGLLEGSCNRPIRKLDIRGCDLISDASLKFFKRPFFRELWWIGVFGTCFIESEANVRSEVMEERPFLSVCVKGCRMGCYKKWNYYWHKVPSCTAQTLSD